MTTGAVLTWGARAAWAAAGVFGWGALDDAALLARLAAGGLWLAGVAALAVPSVVTLTLARIAVPAGLPALGVAWAAGAPAADAAVSLVAVAVAAVAVATGEFGQHYAQASAYGHEQRFPLRPPPAFLLAAAVAWLLAVTGLVGGVALMADERWWIGAPVAVAGAGLVAFAWPRWHRLARRWLVVVPAGLVVHDHLVLSETVMFPRTTVAAVVLAPAGTDAADLTGPASGHPLEVRLHESTTAILAGTPRRPSGTTIHLTACLIAPTRPGRALVAISA